MEYKTCAADKRLGAALLDGALSILVTIVGRVVSGGDMGVPYAIISLAWLVFCIWTWTKGQSPAKMILHMQVIKKGTGEPAKIGTMLLREIIGKFISGLVIFIGYLWIIWDKDKQGWHDKIAGTVVVEKA